MSSERVAKFSSMTTADRYERNLLAALIIAPVSRLLCVDKLKPEHFSSRYRGEAYRVLMKVKRLDLVTATDAMERSGIAPPPDTSWAALFSELLDSNVPDVDDVGYYADRIVELSIERRLVQRASGGGR